MVLGSSTFSEQYVFCDLPCFSGLKVFDQNFGVVLCVACNLSGFQT